MSPSRVFALLLHLFALRAPEKIAPLRQRRDRPRRRARSRVRPPRAACARSADAPGKASIRRPSGVIVEESRDPPESGTGLQPDNESAGRSPPPAPATGCKPVPLCSAPRSTRSVSARSSGLDQAVRASGTSATSSTPLALSVSTTSARSSRRTSGSSCAARSPCSRSVQSRRQTSGRRAARPTGTLLGAGATDFFDEQRVDPAIRIEARDPREAAVDHHPHAIDGQRRLRDVGRDDHLAPLVTGHGGVLLIDGQFAVQAAGPRSHVRRANP